MRKKKLDQCHQFVLFERSAKQVCPSLCLSVCLSVHLFFSKSSHLPLSPSVCLSASLSNFTSICLSSARSVKFTFDNQDLFSFILRSFLLSVLQALEWIHDTGEFYLSTHTNVGENLTETESLLKEHNEFKVTAKVSISSQRNEFKVTVKVSISNQYNKFKLTAKVSISTQRTQ